MSHFSVLVVTDGPATDEALAKAMQPFHEFESTGTDDEFVQDINVTADCLAEYEAATSRRFRDSDGALHDPYDDRFYREWTPDEINSANRGGVAPMGSGTSYGLLFHSQDWGDGCGYRSKVHFVPEGFKDVKVPTGEIMSFAAYLDDMHGIKSVPFGLNPDLSGEHKYGYAMIGADGAVVKVIKRTNVNDKWDWWCVGGRYGGRLAAGYDPEKDPANIETCFLCGGTGTRTDETAIKHHGGPMKCNNCGGTGRSVKFPSKQRDYGNRSRVGDLNLAALKATNVADRRARVDGIRTKMNTNRCRFGMAPMEDLEAAVATYRSATATWRAMDEPRPRGDSFVDWLTRKAGSDAVAYYRSEMMDHIADDLSVGQTVSEFIEAAPALTAYAVLKDGQWSERGKMGWFGMASGEMGLEEWGAKVSDLVAGLSPDQWVTIIDCHI
jgi:hypothetical protein